MKIETTNSPSKEVFVDAGNISVTINVWSNHEGASIMVHSGPDLAMRMAGAFRWEDLDVILVALAAARAA